MIVTIDGPAGAGKSTVARLLAQALNFDFLDTGAMYRAMVLFAINHGTNLEDSEELLLACQNAPLEFTLNGIQLQGQDISESIRAPEISRNVRHVADHPGIRQLLVDCQRALAKNKNVVCEGRDQGTVAFPDAECKFFLTASSQERARRRVEEMVGKGIQAEQSQIQEEQDLRDLQDRSRPVGALVQAPDAEEICTDGLSIEQVVDLLTKKVNGQIANNPPSG